MEQSPIRQTARKRGAQNRKNDIITRLEVLQTINNIRTSNTVVLASTGYIGRELFQLSDDKSNFYMVGSMGCVSSLALGLSYAMSGKKVIAIDGDGALLMRMGAMATNAYYSHENMLHILLDNHVHESTGGQATISANIDWVNLATSLGYANSVFIHNIKEFEDYFLNWQKEGGLTFMYIETTIGTSKDLGRPKIKPYKVKNG